MKEILRQLEAGEFSFDRYTVKLKSGIELWVANGSWAYGFYPDAGTSLTFFEKRAIKKALKGGMIKKALQA